MCVLPNTPKTNCESCRPGPRHSPLAQQRSTTQSNSRTIYMDMDDLHRGPSLFNVGTFQKMASSLQLQLQLRWTI